MLNLYCFYMFKLEKSYLSAVVKKTSGVISFSDTKMRWCLGSDFQLINVA